MRTVLLRFPTVMPEGQFNVSSVAPPLSLACLAAYAELHGFPVTVVDCLGEAPEHVGTLGGKRLKYRGLSPENMLARIPPGTDVIGISCMFSSEWPFYREMLAGLRRAFPGAVLIAGGEHVSALPELVLAQAPGLDLAVIGEGEETLRELLEAISRGAGTGGGNGIAFRRGASIVITPQRERLRAGDLPLPAWDAVPIENYFKAKVSHGPYLGRTLPVLASRGCPYACRFCSNARMWGARHEQRPPEDVVREIELYVEKYNVQCVDFYDPSPVTGRQWLRDFCGLMLARKVKARWQMASGTRVESLDEELVALAGAAGCRYLGFAPESGSPETLRAVDKKLDLADLHRAVKAARKHKLGVKANLVIGFPGETRRQIFRTLLLQLRLALAGVSDAPIFQFSPYPGSAYFEDLRRRKLIPELNDAYFNSLGLNLFSGNRNRYCGAAGPLELSLYQLSGTLLFYAVHYLTHPLEFCKAVLFWNSSSSVFEARLKQNLKALLGGKPENEVR